MDYLQQKALKSLKFLKRNNSSVKLILLGLLIFSFGAFNYYRVRILSFNNSPKPIISSGQKPVRIIIPSLKVDLPIEEGEIKNGVWQISEKSATHLSTSANPDTKGNVVVYGHNKRVIFGNLPYLSLGEKITLKTSDGKIYQYKLVEKLWVKPDRVDLVSPKDEEILTLYTCWGMFDTQRVVLIAKPVIE